MKNIILSILVVLIAITSFAQTSGINYKAILKDAAGEILSNTNVDVEFNILQGAGQALEYSETHSHVATDANGLIILTIGQGTTTAIFDDIDWSRFQHYLNVKIDTGSGQVDMGTTEFMAAPYSLQSDTAKEADVAFTANRLTLKSATTNQFSVLYDASGDKLRVTETGIAGNVMEIKNGELYLPQYAAADNGPLKVDATGKIVSEVILPPGPQITKFNRYSFTQKEENSNYTKYYYGIQFEDGTVLSGIKSFIMDNNTSGSTGVANTAFVGIYRSSKTDNTQFPLPIYRIDASDTPTDQFVEFTQTTLAAAGANIIDNTNYIYFFQIFICDDCLVQEASVMH